MAPYNRRTFLSSVTVALSLTAGCSNQSSDDPVLELTTDERVGSRLSVTGESAFFTTKSGVVYSVSLNSKAVDWKRTVSDSAVTTPVPTDDRVYAGENTMYGLSRAGESRWEYSLFDRLSSAYTASVPPLVTNGEVIFGLTSGHLCALSEEGDLRWTQRIGSSNCHRWSAHERRIVAGTPSGDVACIDRDAESVQRQRYDEPVAPRIAADGIYIGGQSIRRLSTDLSEEKWTVETDAQYTYLPVVSDGQVFVAGANTQGDTGYLYSIDAETGRLDWARTTDDAPSGYPLVDQETGRIIVGTMNDGTVVTFDSMGDVVQSTRVQSGLSGPLRRYGDEILALSKSGSIYSISR